MTETTAAPQAEAFAFGDPEPVLDGGQLQEMAEVIWMGRWYEPPTSLDGLYRAFRSNPHHSSAIQVKRNILMSCWRPSELISRGDLSRAILDYLTFGNLYLFVQRARSGRVQRLRYMPARYMRVGPDRYWYAPNWRDHQDYPVDQIIHLQEADPGQEVYGVPEYLAALQSALLNEAATLFRRKYYRNGSHAGFIMYMTDPVQNEQDIDGIRNALKESKGPGNFRNLFLYAPGGKKDGMQIIPVSEVQAKDEFHNIKSISRDDVLAAHRVPPQLMGIVPTNSAGFGDAATASKVFARNEIRPLQTRLAEANDQIGAPALTFDPYELEME